MMPADALRRSLVLLALALAVFVSSTIGTVGIAQQGPRNPDTAGAACPQKPSQDSKGGRDNAAYVPQEPSEKAVADIPPEMMKAYREAGKKYGVDWTILAGVGAKETDHGRNTADGGGNETGPAQGPMQFTPGTFSSQGVDGNGDGEKNVKDPDDAAHSAANYLKNEGAPEDYRQALTTYNGDPAYADDVIKRADEYKAAAEEDSPGSGKKGAPAFLVPDAVVDSLFSGIRPAFAQDEPTERGSKKANGLFAKKPPKGKRAASKNDRSSLKQEKPARQDARAEERAARQQSKAEARAAKDAERVRQNDESQKQRLADLPKEQADKIDEEQKLPPKDRRAADGAKDSSPEEDAGPQRQVPGPCEKQPPGGADDHASREPESTPPDARGSKKKDNPQNEEPAPDGFAPGESTPDDSTPGESTSADDAFGGSSREKPPRGGDAQPSGDAEDLANDPNCDCSEQAKQDLRDGLVDPRLVKTLQEVTKKHKIEVPWFKTGHSFDGSGHDGPYIDDGYGSAGGLPNTHYYGRSADIFAVNGKPVQGNGNDPDVLDVMKTLERIPGRDRPDQMIAPTDTSATMGASREKGYIMEPDQQELHGDHLHLGYMREDGTNNTI